VAESNDAAAAKRERAIVLGGLALITLLAWAYTIYLAWDMNTMDMALPQLERWNAIELALLLLMWIVMMVAMMAPSASPMILTYSQALRGNGAQQSVVALTTLFALGYAATWTGFSLLATAAQWALHRAALLSPAMISTSARLSGALLIAAGVFQWLPLKHACLARCRSPLGFLMTEWRQGARGALLMGLKHGVYCVGCCWALMLLLFVTGVMNLLWIALIAVFVLLEKVLPAGARVARVSGILLIAYGVVVIAQSTLA
jgi:predicted metal-binding membrane protein